MGVTDVVVKIHPDLTGLPAPALAGLALAAPVVFVWGGTFVSTRALLADFSALEILLLRFALAWCALWAIHPRGMGPLRARDEALFAAAGLAGATAYQMLENAWNKACERLGTVRCSLGLYLVPVVAFLVAHVFLGETLPAALRTVFGLHVGVRPRHVTVVANVRKIQQHPVAPLARTGGAFDVDASLRKRRAGAFNRFRILDPLPFACVPDGQRPTDEQDADERPEKNGRANFRHPREFNLKPYGEVTRHKQDDQ